MATLPLVALAGCISPLAQCEKAYGAGTPSAKACWAAVIQRENAEADRRLEQAARSSE